MTAVKSWAELLEGRKILTSTRNSAHMIESMEYVQRNIPGVELVAVEGGWQLQGERGAYSNVYATHYDCWLEAREALESCR